MPHFRDKDAHIESGRTNAQRDVSWGDGVAVTEGLKTSFEDVVVSSPEPGMTKRNAAPNQERDITKLED